ncbi:unnamed protein product [Allacma fusca]|uniref:Uncharacterized protein n=1 Tax=Allacma fusca TaxID=39272 RepID=A0A8J2L6W2_9HEXA|nr:unnamed protein product [Allacma fusca]
MAWVLHIHKIAISVLILPQIITSTEVTTYLESGFSDVLDCGRIRFLDDIACVCVTGLWRLYGGCSTYYSIAGDSHCLHAPQIYSGKDTLLDVTHAMEILPNKETIAVIRNGSKVIKLETINDERKYTPMLLDIDVVVTGSPHTLKGPLGSVCLHPQDGSYCTYKPREFIGRKIERTERGCKEEVPYIPSVSCVFEKGPQSCHEALIADHLEDAMENDLLDDTLQNSSRREKRQSWKSGSGRGSRIQQKYGRTFLGLSGQILDREVTKLTAEDEDYMDEALFGNMTVSSSETILSEVWNYIDMQAEIVMGLRKARTEDIDYGIPYFQLLHLSKKVMQKVCPAEYVKPGFFEVAVQTFIQVQVKHFIYEEPNANKPGFDRIKTGLQKCAEGVETFPFKLPSEGNNSCTPNSTLGGQFIMFINQSMEVNVTGGFVGLDRDPIIETVWKIFFTVTSFCFPYFKDASYNDHHRYISWMSSLFMNGIHDIWMNNNGTNFTYDQFLGDITVVMERVAYCAASSRVQDILLPYPWEMARPGNFTPPTTTPARKKRGTEELPPVTATSCMSPGESSKCFSNSKPYESVMGNSRWKRRTSVRTVPSLDGLQLNKLSSLF